jgi:hypothetical protein
LCFLPFNIEAHLAYPSGEFLGGSAGSSPGDRQKAKLNCVNFGTLNKCIKVMILPGRRPTTAAKNAIPKANLEGTHGSSRASS